MEGLSSLPCGTLLQGCLSVFLTWWLAAPRVSQKARYGTVSLWPSLEVTHLPFCNDLLATQVSPIYHCGRGLESCMNTRRKGSLGNTVEAGCHDEYELSLHINKWQKNCNFTLKQNFLKNSSPSPPNSQVIWFCQQRNKGIPFDFIGHAIITTAGWEGS